MDDKGPGFHRNRPLEIGLTKATQKFMKLAAPAKPPTTPAASFAPSLENPPFALDLPQPNVVHINVARVRNFDKLVRESHAKNTH